MIGLAEPGDTLTRHLTGREIAADVAERIRAGQYPPDTQLVYDELMDLYGVSRSTIQRAMGRLEAQGLVEFQPGRGTFVCPMITRSD